MVHEKHRKEELIMHKPGGVCGKDVCLSCLCQEGKSGLSNQNKLGKQMAKDYPLLTIFLNVDKFRD